MSRYVTIARQKQVPLGAYVRAIGIAKAAPEQTFKSGLSTFWTTKGREIHEQFYEGLTDRINRRIANYGKGRKWSNEWQIETQRAARALNTPRLVIHWLPKWLLGRFGHRIERE